MAPQAIFLDLVSVFIDFPLEIVFPVVKKLKIFRLRRANMMENYTGTDVVMARRRRQEKLTKIWWKHPPSFKYPPCFAPSWDLDIWHQMAPQAKFLRFGIDFHWFPFRNRVFSAQKAQNFPPAAGQYIEKLERPLSGPPQAPGKFDQNLMKNWRYARQTQRMDGR